MQNLVKYLMFCHQLTKDKLMKRDSPPSELSVLELFDSPCPSGQVKIFRQNTKS